MSDANEVAEDYRLALEDLSSNMRFEISNLTVIARENTEHALTIADVLQTHILKAAPSKKLPALYVLDSIVKNVGTPYTLYFGRNLFKIFMESYAVVDNPIRKKMEEMLRTWKDPVPGAMDMRPVFSHELVRPIENALMKVRAASMPQQAAIPGRPRQSMFPQRDTPTPPGMRGHPSPYPPQGQPYPNVQQPQYSRPSPQPYGSGQGPYQPPVAGQYGTPVGITVDNLPNDIQNLINATRDELSQNGNDQAVQTRLKALMDLQAVVQRGGIPPDQLELIKNKVTELAPVTRRSVSAQPPPPITGNLQPQMQSRQSASVTPTPAGGGPSAPPVSLDSLLGQGALAALMARTASNSQNSTPNPPASAAIRSPPPPSYVQPMQQVPAPNDPMALLNKLRQAGMLSGLPPQNAATSTPPPVPSAMPGFPSNLADILAMAKANAAGNPSPAPAHNFSSLVFKQPFNPNFVNKLYDDLGPPCTQCGRRFRTDEDGRRKKTAHMDWHFKVHQRSAEAEKRGMHRSWYVDQQEWLKSREVVDVDHIAAPEDADAEASKAAEGPKYIHVPEPGSGVNSVCPICQERFENKWLDLAQDWVWLDAVLVRNRAFHASCLAEASKDRDGTPRRTPEPVLGKRKAEPGMSSPNLRTLRTAI